LSNPDPPTETVLDPTGALAAATLIGAARTAAIYFNWKGPGLLTYRRGPGRDNAQRHGAISAVRHEASTGDDHVATAGAPTPSRYVMPSSEASAAAAGLIGRRARRRDVVEAAVRAADARMAVRGTWSAEVISELEQQRRPR